MSEKHDAEVLAHRVLDEPNADPDDDLRLLARQYLRATEARDVLLAAIRRHRDYRGDDRCHLDDGELYAVLPEGDTRPSKDTAVTLENCERFIRCRQQGREYVSPEREIEQLRKWEAKVFAEATRIVQENGGVGEGGHTIDRLMFLGAQLSRLRTALNKHEDAIQPHDLCADPNCKICGATS